MAYRDYDNYINAYDYIINQLFIYDYSDEDDFNILKMKIWVLDGTISVADSSEVIEDDIDDPKVHFESLLNELTFLDTYIKTEEGTLGENEYNFTELKTRRDSVMAAWIANGENDYDMKYSTRPTLLTDAQFALLYMAFVTKRTAGELSVAEDIVKSVTNYCIDNEIFQAERTVLNYIVPSAAEENLTQLASAGIDDHDRNYVTEMDGLHNEIITILNQNAPSASGTLVLVNFPQRREQVSTIFEHSSHKGPIFLDPKEGYLFTYMTSAGPISISPDTNNMSGIDNTGDVEWSYEDFSYGNYWYDSEVTGKWILDFTNEVVDIDSLPTGPSTPGSPTYNRFIKLNDRWETMNRLREDKVSDIGTRMVLESMIDAVIITIETDNEDHLVDKINQKQYYSEMLADISEEFDMLYLFGDPEKIVSATVSGAEFTGNFLTVGNDGNYNYDYVDTQAAIAAASDGDMIVIWPGYYSNTAQISLPIGQNTYIKGVSSGTATEDIHLRPRIRSVNFTGGELVILEGFALKKDYSGAVAGYLDIWHGDSDTRFYVNKLIIDPNLTAGWTDHCIRYDNEFNLFPYLGKSFISYSKLYGRTQAHHVQHSVSPKDQSWEAIELNEAFAGGSVMPSPFDYVTTATNGYGYNYGDNIINVWFSGE
jgi:hypothetical protein